MNKDTLFSIWNITDSLSLILFVLHLITVTVRLLNSDSIASQALLSITVSLMYFRSLGYLRIFNDLRYLVRLVLQVISGLRGFMVLLAIVYFSFSVSIFITRTAGASEDDWVYMEKELKNVFLLGLRDFEELYTG